MHLLLGCTNKVPCTTLVGKLAALDIRTDLIPLSDSESILTYADPSRFSYDAFVFEAERPDQYAGTLNRLRDRGYTVPVAVLGHTDGSIHLICALDIGADAYVSPVYETSKFVSELVSVLKAVIRGRAYGHDDARNTLKSLSRPDMQQLLKKVS